MAQSLYDIVTSQALAAYYEELYSNELPLIGSTLFPRDKKMGLRLEWIKGYDSLPVALNPSAFDTKPPLRDRGGVSIENTKMPFFREAMRIGEEDRQLLLMFLEANQDGYSRSIIQRIFDDQKTLIDGANIIPEIMIHKLITEGKFTMVSDNGTGQSANYEYNYDPSGTWAENNITTLSGSTDKWSDYENSNPVMDILDVVREAKKRGINLTRMMMGYGTWLDIMQNKKIKLDMNPVGAQNIIVTDNMVMQYLTNKTGLTIQITDKMYKDWSGADQYFYPDRGNVTLLPAGTLGKTWYGTTPEEADLMSGNTDANVSIVNTGVAILTKKESLPVNVITSVSEIVLPSFENMNRVFNIKYTP